jgi:hypothetical protein
MAETCEYIVKTLSDEHEISNEYACLVEKQWMHKSLLYLNIHYEWSDMWRGLIEIFM